MTFDDALAELGAPVAAVPRVPLAWLLANWEAAAPRLLGMLDAFQRGEDLAEATPQVLYFALHLMAERREQAAFGPFCRLLHDAEAADLVLGDALIDNLAGLLIPLFDGDAGALRALVKDAAAGEGVRTTALLVLAYLTRIGRLPHPDMRALLRELTTTLQPQAEDHVWAGWVMAASDLGYADLAAEGEALFRRGLVPADVMSVADFRADLLATRADPTGMEGFLRDGIAPITDAMEALEGPPPDEAKEAPGVPVVNPLRSVGRNDPCPCGSGRKYKKCCLA